MYSSPENHAPPERHSRPELRHHALTPPHRADTAAPPPGYHRPVHAAPLPSFITPAIDPRARTAGIAILVSAAVLLVAALTKSWFVAAGNEGGVGLLGLEACRRGMCQSVSWFDVPFIPSQIPIFATTGLIACLATIALLVHTGVMLLQSAPERVKLRWLAHVFGLALVGVTTFVIALSFGDWTRGLTLGWSTVVGFAGLLAGGITAAFVVRPLTRTQA